MSDLLEIITLGGVIIRSNGKPIKGFASRKAEALLVYLACTGREHPREVLADLLWDDRSQSRAMSNLRTIIASLRQHLESYIEVSRTTVGLNPSCAYRVDVIDLEAGLKAASREWTQGRKLDHAAAARLEQALALYRGDFLEGFSTYDCQGFEGWLMLERERLRQHVIEGLHHLVDSHLEHGAYQEGITQVTRLLLLDQLREEAYCQLMRLLALTGQRSAALAQYETCRRLLVQELDTPPSPETTSLYNQIQAGTLVAPKAAAQPVTVVADRFELGGFIAQGGMGVVYQGQDRQTNQPVAIKLLRPEVVANNPEMLTRFAREGEALRKLNHPNIVKMLAAIPVGDQIGIVMEYVSGGSLRDLLKKEAPLPINRIVLIALELSDALARAHHLKIIHCDLKPDNVLLAEDGTPRLTDFGVARMSDATITGTDMVIGTVTYLSPEALAGEPLDARADVWAFGVMLFEMLTGWRPFDGDSQTAITTAILHKPLPDLETLRPETPVALVDLIYRMLEKDRNQRIPSMRRVGAELESILKGVDNALLSEQHTLAKSAGDDPTLVMPTPLTPPNLLHNLPLQTTAFVGRAEELADLAHLLGDPAARLITILGPGGMGKTRLALEAAAAQLDYYPNGVYFVSLAPLNALHLIVSAIAEAVKFRFYQSSEPKLQLLDFLREKSMLLILDNFEHLLAGVSIVTDILQTAPGIKILATSRERLNLQGEIILRIDGMPVPDAADMKRTVEYSGYSAIELFLQSARRVQPHFALSRENAKDITRICQLVAGIPLGILLAAAWVEVLSPPEIGQEIETNLDFLEIDQRDIPERQRSMRAAFDYSWNLLSETEREVFQKLAVFRGGFTREAAQQVADAPLKVLMTLVNKSLLRRDAATGRYDIHELLRQYVQGHLNAFPDFSRAIQDRHCAYFAGWMRQQWDVLKTSQQRTALSQIEREIDNVRAAWKHMVSNGKAAEIDQTMLALWYFFSLRSQYQEALELFGQGVKTLRAMAGSAATDVTLAHLLALQGRFYNAVGNPAKGKMVIEEGLSILRRTPQDEALLMPLESLALVALQLQDLPQAEQAAQEGLQLARVLHDEWWIAWFLYWLGLSRYTAQAYVDARQIGEESLRIAETGSDLWLRACICTFLLGNAANSLEDYAEAKKRYEQGLHFFEEVGQPWGASVSQWLLGNIALLQKDYAEAQRCYQQSFQRFYAMGQADLMGSLLYDIARLFVAQHDPGRAITLLRFIREQPATPQYIRENTTTLLAEIDTAPDKHETRHDNVVQGLFDYWGNMA